MVHASPNNCLAVLDLATAVCVSPGLPICNFELEVWIGLTRKRSGYVCGWFMGDLGNLFLGDANKLVTTKRAIETNNTCYSQVVEPGASSNPPDPH
eukprot:1147162-Pelagomonas_calceolata.AAC.1